MKFLDFPDVIPDEAQQGPIPQQVFGSATTRARRHPCASQPAHKFSVAPAARFGLSWILSRYNRILHPDEDGQPDVSSSGNTRTFWSGGFCKEGVRV